MGWGRGVARRPISSLLHQSMQEIMGGWSRVATWDDEKRSDSRYISKEKDLLLD